MGNILYLSPYFWPEEIGSASYCTDLALWLREKNHEVDVIAFRPHYPNPEQFCEWHGGDRDNENYGGVSITRVPILNRGNGGFKDRLRNDLSFLLTVLRLAVSGRLKKPDVIVSYVPSILTLYGAFLVRVITGARIIAVVHDVESGLASALGIVKSRMILFAMRRIEAFGLNRANHIVVLTDEIKKELELLRCRRPISILSIWAEARPIAPPPGHNVSIVMYSGNFGKKQKLDQLLPLIQRLSSEAFPLRFVMQGDGSERSHFQKKLEAARVTNTSFRSLVSGAEFTASLQSANIHIVPQAANASSYAVPSKLFSIMSAGRPFVSIGEPDSSLDRLARKSGGGICVPPGDEDALYRIVTELSADMRRQSVMGESGRRFVEKYMNRNDILSRYADLISDLSKPHP